MAEIETNILNIEHYIAENTDLPFVTELKG